MSVVALLLLVSLFLLPACKEGGGGGSDPAAGEGELMHSPGGEELGRAPFALIPAGYAEACLHLEHEAVFLRLRCLPAGPNAFTGSAELSLTRQNGLVVDAASLQQVPGYWQQQSYNGSDMIRDVMVECSTETGESLSLYELDMRIEQRQDAEEGITLIGSVSRGYFIRLSAQGRPARQELDGAAFRLLISR